MPQIRILQPLPPVPGFKLPQALADLVAADGQPREATADDGSVHMLYRDGSIVRSVLRADWPAKRITTAGDRAALRAQLQARAAQHAGKKADQLTLPELRDVVAVLAEQAGMLDEEGKVK